MHRGRNLFFFSGSERRLIHGEREPIMGAWEHSPQRGHTGAGPLGEAGSFPLFSALTVASRDIIVC